MKQSKSINHDFLSELDSNSKSFLSGILLEYDEPFSSKKNRLDWSEYAAVLMLREKKNRYENLLKTIFIS